MGNPPKIYTSNHLPKAGTGKRAEVSWQGLSTAPPAFEHTGAGRPHNEMMTKTGNEPKWLARLIETRRQKQAAITHAIRAKTGKTRDPGAARIPLLFEKVYVERYGLGSSWAVVVKRVALGRERRARSAPGHVVGRCWGRRQSGERRGLRRRAWPPAGEPATLSSGICRVQKGRGVGGGCGRGAGRVEGWGRVPGAGPRRPRRLRQGHAPAGHGCGRLWGGREHLQHLYGLVLGSHDDAVVPWLAGAQGRPQRLAGQVQRGPLRRQHCDELVAGAHAIQPDQILVCARLCEMSGGEVNVVSLMDSRPRLSRLRPEISKRI